MAESKKRHNSVNISGNSLRSYSGHLNIDPNLYAKYHSEIQYSKGTTGQQTIFGSIKGKQLLNCNSLSDGSLSQYVTFDDKHNCEVSLRYHK